MLATVTCNAGYLSRCIAFCTAMLLFSAFPSSLHQTKHLDVFRTTATGKQELRLRRSCLSHYRCRVASPTCTEGPESRTKGKIHARKSTLSFCHDLPQSRRGIFMAPLFLSQPYNFLTRSSPPSITTEIRFHL